MGRTGVLRRGPVVSTILVTGASGTVGADVVQALEAQYPGHRVLKASSRPQEGEGWVVFDFLHPETYRPWLDEVNRVFFLRPPALASVDQQFGAFFQALTECRHLEAVVFLSIQGADTMPWVPHAKIEQTLVARNLPWVFLRPAFFFQNLSGTHGKEIRETGCLTLPAGAGRTAFVDTRDIAEVAAKILAEPQGHVGRSYELTGTENLTYTEVMAELSLVTGETLKYRPVGFLRFYHHCRRRGIDRGMTLVMSLLYGLCRTGQASRLSPQMEELLGRPPRCLTEFAKDYADVWR